MYGPDDYRLPERPLEPPASRCLECEDCGEPLCDGAKYIVWNGERLCMKCGTEAAATALDTNAFRRNLDALAGMFGFFVEEA